MDSILDRVSTHNAIHEEKDFYLMCKNAFIPLQNNNELRVGISSERSIASKKKNINL
jgi:hypothetical protein